MNISTIKEENENESIEDLYNKLCLDLNMDNETKEEGWKSYENIRKHYLLEGDQMHWLAVSLYVSCRRNKYLSSYENNPISISRLLKSSNNLDLIVFFDKLNKWQDMANLPDSIRLKINQVENAFNISSIIFEKYTNLFLKIFGGDQYKLIYSDYEKQRTSNEINPKLIQKQKPRKCCFNDLYSLVWTIYALTKTIYPTTLNDLIASFHLLIASFEFIFQQCKKEQLDHLLKGCWLNGNEETIIDKICSMYNCSSEMSRTIYEEFLKDVLFERFHLNENLLNETNICQTVRSINRQYDEIVLRYCFIDERIFIENPTKFNDLLNCLNENRNSKSYENRTPLTANQHFQQFNSNQPTTSQCLTPISQANQLIQFLNSIVQNQTTQLNHNILILIGQQTYTDNLIERLNQWENEFLNEYNSIERNSILFSSEERRTCSSAKTRFQLALKLFSNALQNILIIEKKRLISTNLTDQQIQQSFQKLILNNEFLKSLIGLCLLLVLYAHSDKYHDLHWILNLYKLHGYSFLKIIQIYLKSSKELSQCRTFIKYLSSIEEQIISSMAFTYDSAFWKDIQSKGILKYHQITSNRTFKTPTNLSQMYFQSPITNSVSRNLFSTQTTNKSLTIKRSESDRSFEKDETNVNVKYSPYTMFYRKLYEYVLSRLDLICLRLYGSKSNQFEKLVWNLFIYLFENKTKELFCSREIDQILLSCVYYTSNSNLFQYDQLTWHKLISIYKTIPNSKLKTVRSVFIRQENPTDRFHHERIIERKDPCLTPSKPAGTIHLIDGNIIGDINSFYKEIFVNLLNNEKDLLSKIELNEIPVRSTNVENQTKHFSLKLCQNVFVDYSSKRIQSNPMQTSNEISHINENTSQRNPSSDILSSSIQAGANNTVRTTRTRTEDGKFLTTISTISKGNNLNEKFENIYQSRNETNMFFGQSTNSSLKRSFSDENNSNCLTSLTKKVLQIENDRQNT